MATNNLDIIDNNIIINPSNTTLSSQSSSNVHDHNNSFFLLEKFKLYETQAKFYLVGSDYNKRLFRVLKIDRCETSELNISEDPVVYTQQEVDSLLHQIAEGNQATGGLNFVTKAYGVVGCVKFLEPYYLILVTKRRQIGSICGHAMYTIDESQTITIPHASVQTEAAFSKNELRYKKLLDSIDLTKDFFYSYTYPIMQSLQKNMQSKDPLGIHYDNRFVWNTYLTEAVRSRCKNNIWTVALVHGHFQQTRMSIFGRDFSIALVSRRSRYFAGTRYLKRGVNDRGKVANDVETEQIVLDEDAGSCKGKMSSVVQMRGSIPLFWSQEASKFSPKPDIILLKNDPTYHAAELHFGDIVERYGNPVIVLNLIKTVEKRPREMILRREFANAVQYLNQIFSEENQLTFIHWDFHKFARMKTANVLGILAGVASQALDKTGIYYSGKSPVVKKRDTQLNSTSTLSSRDASANDLTINSGVLARSASTHEMFNSPFNGEQDSDADKHLNKVPHKGNEASFQSGVLRTNCIDCLDRTNVAQYAFGLEALGRQLQAMQISVEPKVDPDSSIAYALMDMYWSMGDALAQQYGGSAAHNAVFQGKQGKWKATTQLREFLKSVNRYYSNAYTDGEKQDAINLFLGYFRPEEGKLALWELDSDYHLHVGGIGDDDVLDKRTPSDANAQGVKVSLEPVPACKQDFTRMKLTSFDKLIERTCSLLKFVRLYSETDQRPAGSARTFRVAPEPDAIEIQLKSPNWLFGQRNDEQNASAQKVASDTHVNYAFQDDNKSDDFSDLNWLSQDDDDNTEEFFQSYLSMSSVDETNGWFGGTLLGDFDGTSDTYKHYAQLCEDSVVEVFENDAEKEQHYADALYGSRIEIVDDAGIEAEMEAAMKEYDQAGSDLGISAMRRSLTRDPSQLTRWISGEEKLCRT